MDWDSGDYVPFQKCSYLDVKFWDDKPVVQGVTRRLLDCQFKTHWVLGQT